ncbi:MAG: ABC transporter ATP-binding protein [Lachnospiraceae bacterium]|nr:ABC transporter ATP-binding protein [Lachnospiraceae bacterium]
MLHFFRRYLSAFKFWKYVITLPLYYLNSMLPAFILYCGIWIAEHALDFYKVIFFMILAAFLYLILGKIAVYHQSILYHSIHQAGKNLKIDLIKTMMKNREIQVDSSILLNDAEKIEENLFLGGIELIEQILFYLLAFGIISYLNIWIALFLSLLSFFIAVINIKSRKKGMFYQMQNSEQLREQLTLLEQTEHGYETILMYQQQENMQKEFHNCAQKLYITQSQLKWNQENISIITAIFFMCSFLVYMFGGNFFMTIGVLTYSQIMLIAQMSNYLFKPIQRIMPAWFQVQSVQKITEKLLHILENTDSADSCLNAETLQTSDPKIQMKQQLLLKLDSFSLHQKEILKSLSLSIKKGEKVLLLGSNGCGKSTLLKYLLGYYGYQKDSLFIDNTDCSSLPWNITASVFSSVDQNFFLLPGSVKENIGCFQNRSNQTQAIQEALSLCDLKEIEDREDISSLSGGQKQRVAIARAIASRRSIMVLDEAFSAVDAKHHFDIEQKLLQIPDLTLIEVVHQIAIENYWLFDKVIFMNQGSIVRFGTPQQLIKEPFIQNLWENPRGEKANETEKSSDKNHLASYHQSAYSN